MKNLLAAILLISSISSPLYAQSIFERLLGKKPRVQDGQCVSLKKSELKPSKSFTMVFVPSGFNHDMAAFEKYVRNAWKTIEGFEPFAADINSMNVIIAKVPHEDNSFCDFDKSISRLLTCKKGHAEKLASSCFSGTKTVVAIHNSPIHGGSGGAIATATTSPYGIPTIIHELGHSMFDLADEYTEKNASLRGNNCSSVAAQCSEWQDLIDAGLATCEPGCRNNSKLTSEDNIMRSLNATTFGHVNNRLICCKYKKRTGSFPQFCEAYRNVGEGLENFCRKS